MLSALIAVVCYIHDFLAVTDKIYVVNTYIGPKIKYRLFPLSDRPTKIAATQKILLPHLRKK
jgi:hypothetical protein